MTKKRKGLLTAGTIVAIIVASASIIMGSLMILCASYYDEKLMIQILKVDPDYTYEEKADGSYYFTTEDEDGRVVTLDSETLGNAIDAVNTLLKAAGTFLILLSVAKLVLAILILKGAYLGKFKVGCTIALLVLSAINGWIVEVVLLIIAMCTRENEYNNLDILSENV